MILKSEWIFNEDCALIYKSPIFSNMGFKTWTFTIALLWSLVPIVGSAAPWWGLFWRLGPARSMRPRANRPPCTRLWRSIAGESCLDLSNTDTIQTLAAEIHDLRLLINNAGVLDFGSALEAPLDAIRRNFEVNFFGTLMTARAFAPVIEGNGGGAIVNVLSVVALASMPGLAAYNASKAALWSITQSLRGSLADRRIAVHGVFPGPVDTEMAAAIDIQKTSAGDVARAVIEGIQNGVEDIFPDPMARQVYEGWRKDHKAVERQFATM
jgi:NADP-dependent 3-hydroxy acid dehydrogenase YdfG